MPSLDARCPSFSVELDMGEYINGATTEIAETDGEEQLQLRILAFTTNRNREFVIKCVDRWEWLHRRGR